MTVTPEVDRRTLESIRTGPRSCACREVDAGWVLCDYHEGYDDALERHLPQGTP